MLLVFILSIFQLQICNSDQIVVSANISLDSYIKTIHKTFFSVTSVSIFVLTLEIFNVPIENFFLDERYH